MPKRIAVCPKGHVIDNPKGDHCGDCGKKLLFHCPKCGKPLEFYNYPPHVPAFDAIQLPEKSCQHCGKVLPWGKKKPFRRIHFPSWLADLLRILAKRF